MFLGFDPIRSFEDLNFTFTCFEIVFLDRVQSNKTSIQSIKCRNIDSYNSITIKCRKIDSITINIRNEVAITFAVKMSKGAPKIHFFNISQYMHTDLTTRAKPRSRMTFPPKILGATTSNCQKLLGEIFVCLVVKLSS